MATGADWTQVKIRGGLDLDQTTIESFIAVADVELLEFESSFEVATLKVLGELLSAHMAIQSLDPQLKHYSHAGTTGTVNLATGEGLLGTEQGRTFWRIFQRQMTKGRVVKIR